VITLEMGSYELQTLKTWVQTLFYSCILYTVAQKINFGNGYPHLHHLHMQKYTEFT